MGYQTHSHGEISIHSPRAGRDEYNNPAVYLLDNFNPLSPCGERHIENIKLADLTQISIHSPRAGRDTMLSGSTFSIFYFNPLSPCGERPCNSLNHRRAIVISIHSPRAGRDFNCRPRRHIRGISIHSPRAGRDGFGDMLSSLAYGISIHSPRAGRDLVTVCPAALPADFNPLSPCGERPATAAGDASSTTISIHSPRAGRDPMTILLSKE